MWELQQRARKMACGELTEEDLLEEEEKNQEWIAMNKEEEEMERQKKKERLKQVKEEPDYEGDTEMEDVEEEEDEEKKEEEEEDEVKNASDGKAAPAKPIRQWHSSTKNKKQDGTPPEGGETGSLEKPEMASKSAAKSKPQKKPKNEEEPEMATDPPPDGPKGPPGPPGPPPDPTGGGAAVVATAVEAKAVDNRSWRASDGYNLAGVIFCHFFTTGKKPVMATILLLLFFTIFYHRETASDGYNLTGTIFHHFYHRETASDGYNLTGTIFHHFFSTGKQPVMATILLVLFFTIFFYHRETASDGYNTTASDGIAPDQLQWTAVTVSFWKNKGKLGWDGSNSLRLFFLVDPKERGSEMRWIYIHPLSKKKQGCGFFIIWIFSMEKKSRNQTWTFWTFWTFELFELLSF